MRLETDSARPPDPADSLNYGHTSDLVPLAVSTVGLCVLLGAGIMTAFLVLNRVMVQDLPLSPDARPDVYQPAATALLAGLLLTLLTPMVLAWALLAPITATYRRFGFAMVSGLGALLVSFSAVPANELFGLAGLAGLLFLLLLAALVLVRRVYRVRSAL